jgi:hypothetical protein
MTCGSGTERGKGGTWHDWLVCTGITPPPFPLMLRIQIRKRFVWIVICTHFATSGNPYGPDHGALLKRRLDNAVGAASG